MRLLKVTQAYYPYLERGGPAVKVKAIADRLVRRGYQVTILTAHYGHPFRTLRCQQEGVEVLYLGYVARYRAITINPGVITFCLRHLRSYKVIHIYGIYDFLGPVVALFARYWEIPYLLEPIGMYRPIVRSLGKKRLYHLVCGRKLALNARWVIATSSQEKEELLAQGIPSDLILLRRNGIDLPSSSEIPPQGFFRRKWQIPKDTPLLLFLGRLSPKKSPDLLLRACARISFPGYIVLAGPTEERDYLMDLRKLTATLGLAGRVFFTGPLYREDKWGALQDADLLVLPSQNENFGNVAGEAIACGTPVLLTENCGIAEYIDGKAGLAVPYGEESLAEGLNRLLTDRNFYDRLRHGCAETALSLGWEEPIQQMEYLYQEVASLKKPLQIVEKKSRGVR